MLHFYLLKFLSLVHTITFLLIRLLGVGESEQSQLETNKSLPKGLRPCAQGYALSLLLNLWLKQV